MADTINTIVFGYYPYLALTILALGTIVRYDHEPYTWKAGSSQLLRRKQLVMGSVLFHVGVLMIFAGHIVGLLTPLWVWDMLGVTHTAKQWVAIIAGGIAGVMGIIGATLLVHRRFFDARVRATSNFADNMIILILWVQLALGLGTIFVSLQHLDGHEMVELMTWAQGIFTFNPEAASHMLHASPIFKAHIFLGLTIFVLFPFTRLVHMLSAPIRYLWRPGYQVVRTKKRTPAE
ncbi:MAG: respiratory nitrate reductase subunit gamma [Hyphomicrobiales bacterium]|nr:MAG: respiratory nitrate reductase subunit gamma [Hyphomicrobiales bacterium]